MKENKIFTTFNSQLRLHSVHSESKDSLVNKVEQLIVRRVPSLRRAAYRPRSSSERRPVAPISRLRATFAAPIRLPVSPAY